VTFYLLIGKTKMSLLTRRTVIRNSGLVGVLLLSGGASRACDQKEVKVDGTELGATTEDETSQADVEEAINKIFAENAEIEGVPPQLAELQRAIRESLDNDLVNLAWVQPEAAEDQPETTTRRVNLGSSPLPNQHRVHRHGLSLKIETRQAKIKVWAEISHPSLNDFVNDAVTCAVGAGTASVITAAVASPAVGLAAFLPSFKACLAAKVSSTVATNTSVRIHTATEHSCWSNHC
jgi:hypothetical protein